MGLSLILRKPENYRPIDRNYFRGKLSAKAAILAKIYALKQILVILVGILFYTVHAQESESFGVNPDIVPDGLVVGAKAPDFTLLSQDGISVNMAEHLKKGPVVLIFYRGAWCPVCNRYLAKLVDSLGLITSRGAQILAITPNKLEQVAKTDSLLQNKLLLLADDSGEVMDKYKVSFGVTEAYQEKIRTKLKRDIAKDNKQQEARLPVPATFIISEEGQIIWRHFDLNYKNRASVKQMLQNLP